MKTTLTLTYFKCYLQKTFVFPTERFVLIRGVNGSGKSTIFKAYSHALYGNQKNPYSHGKTTCRVVLDSQDSSGVPYTITRNSHPTHLTLTYNGKLYEQGMAQDVIDTTIMGLSYHEFRSVSFIRGIDVSLIHMTPSKRLAFIEKLSSSNSKLYKTRLLARMAERKTQYTVLDTEDRLLSRRYKDMVVPVKVKRPDRSLASLNQLMDKKIAKITEYRKSVALWHETSDSYNRAQKSIKVWATLETELKVLNDQYMELDKQCTAGGVSKKDLESAKSAHVLYQKYTEWVHAIQQLNSMIETPPVSIVAIDDDKIRTMEHRIKLNTDATVKEDQLKQLRNRINAIGVNPEHRSIEPMETIVAHIKTIGETIAQYEQAIHEMRVFKQKVNCPSCNTELCYNDGHLVAYTKEYNGNSLNELVLKLADAKKTYKVWTKMEIQHDAQTEWWSKWDTLMTDHDESVHAKCLAYPIGKYKKALHKYRESIHQYNYSHITWTTTCESLRRTADDILNQYPEIKTLASLTPKEVAIDMESAEKTYKTLKMASYNHSILAAQLNTLRSKRDKLQTRMRQISTADHTVTITAPDPSHLKNIMTFIDEAQGHMDGYKSEMASWGRYNEYKKQVMHYKEAMNAARQAVRNLEAHITETGHMQTIIDVCKEAEILSNQFVVDRINEALHYHLDALFDEDIVLTLEAYKTVKEGSKVDHVPSMAITSEYNGRPLKDFLEDLSDGELQRCVLAFRLAMGDVIGRKFIFLDESLNKFDSEALSKSIDHLRDIALGDDIPIYIISHHAIDGLFQNVIAMTPS